MKVDIAKECGGSSVVNLRRQKQCETITAFRDYYQSKDAIELESVSLVSQHDPSIRFTNSTTSVMKPLFKNRPYIDDKPAYLTQPAMGQQGLQYWKENNEFGRYASYFSSLGAIYSINNAHQSAEDIVYLSQKLGVTYDRLFATVYEDDDDLAGILEKIDIKFETTQDLSSFRHSFGLDRVVGRNLNINANDANGVKRTLGSLTLIQATDRNPLAYEVSFDSTTATALACGLRHPVESHYTPFGELGSSAAIAFVDTMSTSAALIYDGLYPKSRGRSGVLRNFIKEYIYLGKTVYGLGAVALKSVINEAIYEESIFRGHMSPGRFDLSNQVLRVNIDNWIDRLSPHGSSFNS